MDIVRRNTDYALRAMVNLARNYGLEPKSTRLIAQEEEISYQLACKLLQRLNEAKLVESTMGPRGGFTLRRQPSEITLGEVIECIQGPVCLNRCLLDLASCKRSGTCPVHRKFAELQKEMADFLSGTTLAEVCGVGDGNEA